MGDWIGEIIIAAAALVTGVWAWHTFRQNIAEAEQARESLDRLECFVEEVIDRRRKANGRDKGGTSCHSGPV